RRQVERQTRGEPPGETRVDFRTQVVTVAISDGTADVARGDTGTTASNTTGIDLLRRPGLHDVGADSEGRRQRIAGPRTDPTETILVVPDRKVGVHAAGRVIAHERVEVIDADVADFTPAGPPLGVGADRLEEVNVLPGVANVLSGLVTRGVRSAGL